VHPACRRYCAIALSSLPLIWSVYREGGVVAGTSAGAAIMSSVMFRDAPSVIAVRQGRWIHGDLKTLTPSAQELRGQALDPFAKDYKPHHTNRPFYIDMLGPAKSTCAKRCTRSYKQIHATCSA
jgi:peptidase E